MTTLSTRNLAAIVIAVFASQACSDDEGGGGGTKDDAKKAADKKKKDDAKKKAKKPKKQPEPVSYIVSLEQKVKPYVDKEGNPLVRRPVLTTRDFSATENRDPFRSFVLPQVAVDDTSTTGPALPIGPVTAPTPQCAKLQLIASNFAIDDLDLIGIVKRGQKRFAQFRDTRGVGHIVDKGKCLGREKGKVVEIGDSLVCYEVLPEQPQDATAVTVAVKKCVALYPEEITDTGDEEIDLSARPDILAPSEPTQPSGPPPATVPAAPPGGPPGPP